MFNEYYKKLVLKYLGGKNISLLLSEIVRKLFEIDWNVSCFWFLIWLFSGTFFPGNETKSTKIDTGISQAARDSSKISMTKNIFEGRVETTLTVEKASFKRYTTDVWKNYGYFNHQACDFSIEKANLPEMSILYINQAYQPYMDNKTVYYCDYFIVRQVTPCLNPPEDLKNVNVSQMRPKSIALSKLLSLESFWAGFKY